MITPTGFDFRMTLSEFARDHLHKETVDSYMQVMRNAHEVKLARDRRTAMADAVTVSQAKVAPLEAKLVECDEGIARETAELTVLEAGFDPLLAEVIRTDEIAAAAATALANLRTQAATDLLQIIANNF